MFTWHREQSVGILSGIEINLMLAQKYHYLWE